MPTGKYDHRGIPKVHIDLHPTYCRCGNKWNNHQTGFTIDNMKPDCVICSKPIGVIRGEMFVPNQYPERYMIKGNYCDKCNNKCGEKIHSDNLSFWELFKNK